MDSRVFRVGAWLAILGRLTFRFKTSNTSTGRLKRTSTLSPFSSCLHLCCISPSSIAITATATGPLSLPPHPGMSSSSTFLLLSPVINFQMSEYKQVQTSLRQRLRHLCLNHVLISICV